MAITGTAIHTRDVENRFGMGRIASLILGLLLLAAVGCAGKFIEQSIAAYTKAHNVTFPNIEYVLWAIVIGLIVANTSGDYAVYAHQGCCGTDKKSVLWPRFLYLHTGKQQLHLPRRPAAKLRRTQRGKPNVRLHRNA